ncbi:iron chelate uptake ABC transporter family permease subunit [Nonomuraea sp. NPDC047529]|uniref:FecCD family ABC transporter permease n=1 Tax=Nonomuraea sp. NPDC047529 TaxID=3155623 RepID=UPI0033F00556
MTVRVGPWSVRLAPRSLLVCAALVAIGCGVAVAAIATGEFTVSVPDVLDALFGQGTPVAELIVSKLRAPRVVTGLLVGAAFGAGGAIFQSLTKNPLGSPDFIGFSAGASTGGIVAVVAGGSAMTIAGGALAGCVVTAVLVYALAFRRGVQGYRLVLVGIGANTLLLAVNNYLLTRANINDAATAGAWLTGSLSGRGWDHAIPVAVALAVLLPVCALVARPMRMIEMGDDAAKAMGVKVEAVRAVAVTAGVLLTGVATAAAGPVVFVALAAPQIARRLTRSPGVTMGTSALMGAVLLTASDLVAQRLLAPAQLPVGVVTAAVGGTYLALLLRKDRH